MNKLLIIFLIFCSISINAQKPKVKNNPSYDDKPLHFGFSLGLNTMDFNIQRNSADTIFADVVEPQPGFQVNIVTNLKLGNYFDLRFLPGITFGERHISYISIRSKESFKIYEIESNFIDFPLTLKYKAKRINNFRPYLIGGLSARYDMSTRKKKDDNNDNEGTERIKLTPLDFCYELGGGIDFYLTHFKLSVELKMSVGLKDVLQELPSSHENAIDRLSSKLVLLSFHFE